MIQSNKMKNIEYYLNKGFDKRSAEYFSSGRRRIVGVVPYEKKKLLLTFDNNEKRVLDIEPIIKPDTVFAFLADDDSFNRVYLDDTYCVAWDIDPNVDSKVVWNNKVDLCPDSCYMDSVPII